MKNNRKTDQREKKSPSMADDDDEVFGDFNFVSAAATTSFHPNLSTVAQKPQPAASAASDDDDWGDFVTIAKPPVVNGFGPALAQFKAQTPHDPFGFFNFSNGASQKTSVTSAGSDRDLDRVLVEVSETRRWEKPSGALPLSLFGEEEERDESASQELTALTENEGFERKESSLNARRIGDDDLMSNLSSKGLRDMNGGSNSEMNVEQEEEEEEDEGWEFKAAEPQERVVNVNSNVKGNGVAEVAELAESSTFVNGGIQNNGGTAFFGGFGIPEFNNVSVASNGTSHGNDGWGFSFESKPSSVAQDNFFSETYIKSKKTSNAGVSDMFGVADNEWEFKDAISVTGSEHKLEEAKGATPAGLELHKSDFTGADSRNDFFSGSSWVSHPSSGCDFAFPFITSSGTKDGIISDAYSNDKKDDIELSNADNHVESDGNVWEFRDAFSESGSKLEGESVVASNFPTNITSSPVNDENQLQQHSEVTLKNHCQALPLSMFGDEELETDASSAYQDFTTQTVASNQMNSARKLVTNLSISDLISSLYSQVEQNTKIHTNESEVTMYPANAMLESDLDDDAEADDDTWEFKDAVSEDQNPTSIANLEDSPQNTSTKIQLEDFVELYCKLKKESYFLAVYHLDQKKKAQSSGEDTTKALDEEIQQLYDELPEDNIRSEQLSPRNTYLNELHKALQELQSQVIESEYHLSQRLYLAESDLTSAIELLRHATAVLRILRLGSTEEQSKYIAVWTQMVSICSGELKHGSLILKESVEKNVLKDMLSEPQGKQYVVALGEIYRVVLILRASTKLYSPWMLFPSSDSSTLFNLLNECCTLWSSSGLDEALRSVSDKDDLDYSGHVNALLESLMSINHLDTCSLQNHLLSGQEAICSLSLLTAAAVPGIKMVVWNDVHYFLTLANLWINLVGCEPPRLAQFSFS